MSDVQFRRERRNRYSSKRFLLFAGRDIMAPRGLDSLVTTFDESLQAEKMAKRMLEFRFDDGRIHTEWVDIYDTHTGQQLRLTLVKVKPDAAS